MPEPSTAADRLDVVTTPGSDDTRGTAEPPAPAETAETAEPAWETTPAARLAFTSYVRVVAMVAVVLIHTAGLTYGNDDLKGTPTWWVAALATFATKWAVPTFVMVSGALLLKPPPGSWSAGGFYRRRLDRIGIPLVVWHVVYVTLVVTVLTDGLPVKVVLARILSGEAYTGLYFFWLILGLYLITPALWPVTAALSRRALTVLGAGLVALAAANFSTLLVVGHLQPARSARADPTIFTQFLPYVGFFVLGYALRDVVVRGRGRVLALAALTVALCLELTWQVTGPFVFGVPAQNRLNILVPVSYQGWVLGAASVAVFLLGHAIVHPASRAARPTAARRARQLGDLTLGVYATHLLVVTVLTRLPHHPRPHGALNVPELVVLCGATLVGATVLTQVLRRLPVLRRTV